MEDVAEDVAVTVAVAKDEPLPAEPLLVTLAEDDSPLQENT